MDDRRTKAIHAALEKHMPRIAEIIATGDVAVVVDSPAPDAAMDVATLGWHPGRDAFALSRDQARRAVAASDEVTEAWLYRRGGPGRIWLWIGKEDLLLNYEPDKGFWGEPGSVLDSERS